MTTNEFRLSDHIAGDISTIANEVQTGKSLILNTEGKLTTASGIRWFCYWIHSLFPSSKCTTNPEKVSQTFLNAIKDQEFDKDITHIARIVTALRKESQGTQITLTQSVEDKIGVLEKRLLQGLSPSLSPDELLEKINEMEDEDFARLSSQEAIHYIGILREGDFAKIDKEKLSLLLKSAVPSKLSRGEQNEIAGVLCAVCRDQKKAKHLLSPLYDFQEIGKVTEERDKRILAALLFALNDAELKEYLKKKDTFIGDGTGMSLQIRNCLSKLDPDTSKDFYDRCEAVLKTEKKNNPSR
jgi:hypothetical protein